MNQITTHHSLAPADSLLLIFALSLYSVYAFVGSFNFGTVSQITRCGHGLISQNYKKSKHQPQTMTHQLQTEARLRQIVSRFGASLSAARKLQTAFILGTILYAFDIIGKVRGALRRCHSGPTSARDAPHLAPPGRSRRASSPDIVTEQSSLTTTNNLGDALVLWIWECHRGAKL